MAGNDKIQGVRCGLVLKSIAAAIAVDVEKEKNSCIIIAYAKGDTIEDIRFTAVKLPKKETYQREDFLSAICHAENVKGLSYVDFDGKDKDIYICRPNEGDVFDFVGRDDIRNRYVDGFAEVEASHLNFTTDTVQVKPGKLLDITVSYSTDGIEFSQNSLQYAIINAFNACLLGRILSREEFHLETGDGSRVKYEIRSVSAKYVDLSTLYIKPEINEGVRFVSSYVTEPMNIINGDEITTRVYRFSYRASFNGYYVTRIN